MLNWLAIINRHQSIRELIGFIFNELAKENTNSFSLPYYDCITIQGLILI